MADAVLPPCWTASTPGSSPTASSTSCRCPPPFGATRTGGIDLNKPRIRAVLSAVLALAPAPGGFTVAELTAKVSA